ncbi:hypothetical protein ARTHRO9AX_220481 [Arthrobacter sp. 9AX]|nr:hypothetical protein ARTHRO9AX_220481 [Arthrobacter sp. 9AX]
MPHGAASPSSSCSVTEARGSCLKRLWVCCRVVPGTYDGGSRLRAVTDGDARGSIGPDRVLTGAPPRQSEQTFWGSSSARQPPPLYSPTADTPVSIRARNMRPFAALVLPCWP